VKIIQYSSHSAKDLTDIFYSSVHSIDASIYSTAQKNAWAPLPVDYDKWATRLDLKKPFILTLNNEIAGFIELEPDGHIDCAYVAPKHERKGVATKMLQHVIQTAKQAGIKELNVEASMVAKPLFERLGFIVENENEVMRNNTLLVNYSMRLSL